MFFIARVVFFILKRTPLVFSIPGAEAVEDAWTEARTAPSEAFSFDFVPGLPHVMLIELRQALISYQDYRMLCLSSWDRPLFRTRIATCYPDRAATGPRFRTRITTCFSPLSQVAYPTFSRALNATGRQMYFLACYDRWLDKKTNGPKPGFRASLHP